MPEKNNNVLVRHAHDVGDYHEPVWLGRQVFRDSRGRPHQHGRTRFAVVVCNNVDCQYEVLVNVEALVAGVKKR